MIVPGPGRCFSLGRRVIGSEACRDFNSFYSSLFPKLGGGTRVFKILVSKPFWISEIFHHSHRGLCSAWGFNRDEVIIMNFAPLTFLKPAIGKKEERRACDTQWAWVWDGREGRRESKGVQSAGDPMGPVPQSLREPPRDSSPTDHSWPQMGDLSSSTIKPHHYPWLCPHRPWNSYRTAALL